MFKTYYFLKDLIFDFYACVKMFVLCVCSVHVDACSAGRGQRSVSVSSSAILHLIL